MNSERQVEMGAKGVISTKVSLSEQLIVQGQLSVQERAALAKILQPADDSGAAEVEAHQMIPPGMGTYEFTKRYQEDLLREARKAHMVEEAMARKPSFFSKLETRLGKLMVATGRKLMAQGQPARKSPAAAD